MFQQKPVSLVSVEIMILRDIIVGTTICSLTAHIDLLQFAWIVAQLLPDTYFGLLGLILL